MTKQETYRELSNQIKGLTEDETDLTANLANTAAAIYHKLDQINWAGFYLWRGEELVLGPFQGKPACIRIEAGDGVCGTAVEERETMIVPNVEEFPGHIACDPNSSSEAVVPIIINEEIKGVLDIDSPIKRRFTEEDGEFLEEVVQIISKNINWERL